MRKQAAPLRGVWADAAPTLKRLTILMWILGGLLGAASLAADELGLWATRPFLTNLVSAAVGGLIGVPIALLVFQKLALHQVAQLDAARSETLVYNSALTLDLVARRLAPQYGHVSGAERWNEANSLKFAIAMKSTDIPKVQDHILDWGPLKFGGLLSDVVELDSAIQLYRETILASVRADNMDSDPERLAQLSVLLADVQRLRTYAVEADENFNIRFMRPPGSKKDLVATTVGDLCVYLDFAPEVGSRIYQHLRRHHSYLSV